LLLGLTVTILATSKEMQNKFFSK